MKKTLLALVAAVVLLALALFFDHRRDVSRHSEKFAFDTTQKADVVSLRITLQKDTVVLLKTGGQWIAMPDSFPLDTSKIHKELSNLLGLQSKEIVSSNPARLAEYGLDTAEAKHVEWQTSGGKNFRVVLGKTSGIDYSSTYWKFEDGDDVFSTPGNFSWEIASRSAEWKDHNFFGLTQGDIKDVRVDWRDSADQPYHYKLDVVNDTTVRMTEPESSSVAGTLAQRILSQCTQLSIDGFTAPGDTNLRKTRLDTPIVDVKMDLKNGKSYEVKGGRTFETFVYVQDPVRKDVVKLSSWRFEPFQENAGTAFRQGHRAGHAETVQKDRQNQKALIDRLGPIQIRVFESG